MYKRFVFIFYFLLIFMISGCGIKKFPYIPFFKSPPTVKKVEYKIKNGKLLLYWDKINNKKIKNYNVYMSKAPVGVQYCLTCDKNFNLMESIDPENFQHDTISVFVENLDNNFKYCYAVKVETKNNDEGKFSNKICFSWYYDKNIIKNVSVYPEDRSLLVSWKKGNITNIDFQGVNIYKKTDNDFELVANEPVKESYLIRNLKNGTKYTFYVAPTYYFNKTLIEGKFVKVVGIPEDLTPPELPKFFNGFYTNGGIFLKWSRSVSDDILGYDIIRKKEGEKRYKQINESIIKKEKFFDNKVEKGKVYYYKIRCIDKNFNPSDYSKPVKLIAE